MKSYIYSIKKKIMMLNPIFDLLTEDEQDELIRKGLACCGAYDSESGCCPFRT